MDDFYEICYFSTFRKSEEKIQVSLKSDNNYEHFTWTPEYILIISRSILLRMRNNFAYSKPYFLQ